jgi:hypothetical protein
MAEEEAVVLALPLVTIDIVPLVPKLIIEPQATKLILTLR